MLKAIWRFLWPLEAEPTRKGRDAAQVTRDEVKELIAEYMKEINFEWTEWYEKFDKLHMRLSKREKRAKVQPEQHEQIEMEDEPRLSVLRFRRLGSV